MRIPFFSRDETEQRASSYTDAITDYLLRASTSTNESKAVAAVEIAVGLWGRSFASASVTPVTPATMALTPWVLSQIGRRLCLKGEALFEVQVDMDGVELVEASTWTITGDPDRASWRYEMTFPGPSMIAMRNRPRAAVAHLQYESDPNEPWRGRGPLHGAAVSQELLSRLEKRLSDEASQPVGHALPVPNVESSGKLLTALQALKGELVLVESTSAGWSEGKGSAPLTDWEPRRLGFNPPEAVLSVRDSTAREILAACGVPVTMLADAQGSALRESYREFLHGTVQPLARIVAQTLGEALDTPDLAFDFESLMASDIQGRARSFASMVTAGMPIERAAALSGLLASEEE